MQREIQWFMRPYLIDFLIEAHAAFALLPETLFLTVNLLDRYCSKRVVYKQHYQLVGCAALLIAAKYGDKKDRVPQINELNNMCCGLYDSGMFTQMEMHVLNTLEWTIGHPTVDFFTQLIVAEEADDREVEHMAAYLCEIALYHRDFVSTKPSIMARASLALARAILGRPEVSDGEWDHVENVTVLALSQHLHQPSVTLSRKYSSHHLSRVSGKLAEFLAQQAAISRRAQGPPSPPAEPTLSTQHPSIYSTPQKGHGAAIGVADGYLTPPITPDSVNFGVVTDPMNKYVPPGVRSLLHLNLPVRPGILSSSSSSSSSPPRSSTLTIHTRNTVARWFRDGCHSLDSIYGFEVDSPYQFYHTNNNSFLRLIAWMCIIGRKKDCCIIDGLGSSPWHQRLVFIFKFFFFFFLSHTH